MSLRGRLVGIALIVTMAIVASVQIVSNLRQQSWLESNVPSYFHQESLRDIEIVSSSYAADDNDGAQVVRRILETGPGEFRRSFRDILVTNGRAPGLPGSVDLNPMGASHRDPHTFPLDEIRAGLRDAMATGSAAFAAAGICLPLRSGSNVIGAAWFQSRLPAPPGTPWTALLVPVLIGGTLFGLAVYWFLDRSVAKPLGDLARAAASVGAGEPGVRVPDLPGGGREIGQFIESFNEMATRVEGYREELNREVKRATETAEKRQAALLRSARLASMGTLAAGIAHEINNPIGGMINAIRRIGGSEQLDERERRYVELIQNGLERVGGIARRLLDFSPRRVEAIPFSLSSTVEGARHLTEHRFRRQGVELRVDGVDDRLPNLLGDEHEFQQVLLNLFLNSLDVLAGRPDPRWIQVRARVGEGPSRLVIEVEDNGPGLPAEDLPRVLDPFFTATGKPGATGLGMFISHQIVENQGGELELESREGEGFKVTLRMPVVGA